MRQMTSYQGHNAVRESQQVNSCQLTLRKASNAVSNPVGSTATSQLRCRDSFPSPEGKTLACDFQPTKNARFEALRTNVCHSLCCDGTGTRLERLPDCASSTKLSFRAHAPSSPTSPRPSGVYGQPPRGPGVI
ncbi:uncharacterized protein PV09_05936 [Verruconis gallopava]|uniref:Uncharacterized protein n=1 Tax=Verruconis gallopava TaxID=253628 RepID=A0A0D1XKM8_9PEZI|nr:uncharacterized protein PV09_05936 [Verruconis gallopava]KIW02886.1 hypothetical protein PV09_05936 [Verruconis gallopava]